MNEYKDDVIDKDRYAAVLEVEKAEGFKEGIKIKSMARGQLRRGRPISEIMEDSGWSQKEVENLKSTLD